MNKNCINGELLREMITAAATMLEANKQRLNDLNVFPVPDGDTGTNMTLTMQSVVKEVSGITELTLANVARSMSRGALKGARGNSGVILSQVLRGFARQFETVEEAGVKDLALAFRYGSETAYKAVMKPKEGTILTVIRVISEKCFYQAETKSLAELMDYAISVGEETLLKTPDMLPQLKKAGVVDAGGQGLMTILHAFNTVLHGEELPQEIEPFTFSANVTDSISRATSEEVAEMDEIKFAYCTEFFIQNLKEDVTEASIDALRNRLAAIGDSLVVVGDPELVKVHVHTNTPGTALQYALELGELHRIKIENMVQQFRELQEKRQADMKETGIVAVASGEGLVGVLKDLGVDEVVTGGQTMNPSTEDIADAIKRVSAKNVIVLPNNSNIILAAEQAQDFTNKKVYVIPTKSVPQGIAAMLAFNPDSTAEENFAAMKDGFGCVATGNVTYAVRDTEFDGRPIHQGDYLGLFEGDITCCGKDLEDITVELISAMVENYSDLVTIYFGADSSEEAAQAIAARISEKFPETEVDVVSGGQPVYYYIISAE